MDDSTIYLTRGLAEALLELAENADPERLTVGISVSRAGELEGDVPIDPNRAVFTDFYLPDAGESVSAVFGVELGIPPGRTQGRFISHPNGELEVQQTDDLHATVLVAVPPYTTDSMAAFTRRGERQPLELLDATPPDEVLAWDD